MKPISPCPLLNTATADCEVIDIEVEKRQAVVILLNHIERAAAFRCAALRPSGAHLPGVLADTFTSN